MSTHSDSDVSPGGPQQPSEKALGKRPARQTEEAFEEHRESQQPEEQHHEPEEQHGSQPHEIEDSQLDTLPPHAPQPGLVTTSRFQSVAHPDHLSPFEKVMLNNQRLMVEMISGVNAKVDYLMTTG
jgi:hypothetical protein